MTNPTGGSPFADIGGLRQAAIYLQGLAGRKPRVPTDPASLEERAKHAMSKHGWAYISGGAGAEVTMRANREAFGRWQLTPRVLGDVASRDLSVTLFGRTLPAPLLLAPVGVLEMAHRDADLAVAKAAASLGVPMIFSSQASVAMETCAAAMGSSPRWFQLYWSRMAGLMESFVRRAESCGCDAIVLTVDTKMLGWRPRDLNLGSLPFLMGKGIAQYTSDPVFRAALDKPLDAPASKAPITLSTILGLVTAARRYPGSTLDALRSGQARRAIQHWVSTFSYPGLAWRDLPRLRAATRLSILLKGVQHPDDARKALDVGVDGLIVSNHGGRQADDCIASLDALPGVVDAVGGKVPVLFDSGIRTGADAVLAIALGASAVCIGRPYVYGLAIAGDHGVRDALENIIAEIDLTMALTGSASVADIRRAGATRRDGQTRS